VKLAVLLLCKRTKAPHTLSHTLLCLGHCLIACVSSHHAHDIPYLAGQTAKGCVETRISLVSVFGVYERAALIGGFEPKPERFLKMSALMLLGISVLVYYSNQMPIINPLKTKRRPLYLKTQSVPRCKHFSSRLQKPTSKWHKSLFVLKDEAQTALFKDPVRTAL